MQKESDPLREKQAASKDEGSCGKKEASESIFSSPNSNDSSSGTKLPTTGTTNSNGNGAAENPSAPTEADAGASKCHEPPIHTVTASTGDVPSYGQGQKRARPEDAKDIASGNKKPTMPSTSTSTPTAIYKADDAEKKGKVGATKAASEPGSVNNENIIDIAQAIDLKPGSRIEVRWDLHFGDTSEVPFNINAESIHPENNATMENSQSITQTRWWGGTLLHPDGRMHTLDDAGSNDTVQVPIRVIDYDPYIEGGFPDRSLEDVCFLTDHSLLNMGNESESRMWWRKEGDTWMPNSDMDEEECKLMSGPVSPERVQTNSNSAGAPMSDDEISVTSTSREDALKIVLNTVLQGALQKAGIGEKMNQLHPSQQSFMAEKIAKAKEKLAENLLKQLNNSGAATASNIGSCVGEGGALNNGAVAGNGNGDVEQGVITKEHVQKCMEELKDL